MSQVGARLTEILRKRPPHEPVDMSEACMCETIDALGLAGFDKAFKTIEAISQGVKAELLHVSTTLLHATQASKGSLKYQACP